MIHFFSGVLCTAKLTTNFPPRPTFCLAGTSLLRCPVFDDLEGAGGTEGLLPELGRQVTT